MMCGGWFNDSKIVVYWSYIERNCWRCRKWRVTSWSTRRWWASRAKWRFGTPSIVCRNRRRRWASTSPSNECTSLGEYCTLHRQAPQTNLPHWLSTVPYIVISGTYYVLASGSAVTWTTAISRLCIPMIVMPLLCQCFSERPYMAIQIIKAWNCQETVLLLK